MAIETVSPVSLMSERISLMLTGLIGGEGVRLRAETRDRQGEVWRSEVVFEVPVSGVVDLSVQAPSSGSYSGVDAAGLIWGMCPRDDLDYAYFESPDDGFGVTLTAEQPGHVPEQAALHRLTRRPDLTRLEVREAGLHGILFMPPGPVRGAVLELGGSEGGLYETRAALLASHGFLVLALGYFALPGLPEQVINVPLEYFGRALAWLRARPEWNGGRVGVLGTSKGGELALLLGTTYPEDVGAVVGVVPSGLVFEGIDRVGNHPPGVPMSSWSLGGQPLPYISYIVKDWSEYFSGPPPVALTPAHQSAVAAAAPATLEAARIRVENIRGPVLLVSGGDDQVWQSTELANIAQAGLETSGGEVVHLTRPDAGHLLSVPGLPTFVRSAWSTSGGTPAANAHLQQLAWESTLDTLARARF